MKWTEVRILQHQSFILLERSTSHSRYVVALRRTHRTYLHYLLVINAIHWNYRLTSMALWLCWCERELCGLNEARDAGRGMLLCVKGAQLTLHFSQAR